MTTQTTTDVQQVRFPITESFTASTPANPHWKLLGSARLDRGCLELTPDKGHEAGTAFLDQPFSSSLGVTIDFDYACVSGGGAASGTSPGDGFCLYLIDGAETTGPGASGAALGYSLLAEDSPRVPGVTAGYVGIGFDSFGNFATPLAGPGGSERSKDTLGVRGSGSGLTGFRWLTGAKAPGGFQADWDEGAHIQVSVVDGRLTVRRSTAADRNGSLLIDGFDLRGRPGQAAMPTTFKLGLSAGTGFATAAHRIRNLTVALPVDMPVKMSGPQKAEAGHRASYAIEIQNLGPNDAPDAVVEGEIPAQLRDVRVSCQGEGGASRGAAPSTGGLPQPVHLPKGSKMTVSLEGIIDPHYEGALTCTGRVTSSSRANTAAQQSGSVRTVVERPRISVSDQNLGGWVNSWPEDAKGWIGSHKLTLFANERRVVAWEVSFEVPPSSRISPTEKPWYRVLKDGKDGTVVIASPADGEHSIEPGTPLDVAVKVLFPDEAAGRKGLRNVGATEVTSA